MKFTYNCSECQIRIWIQGFEKFANVDSDTGCEISGSGAGSRSYFSTNLCLFSSIMQKKNLVSGSKCGSGSRYSINVDPIRIWIQNPALSYEWFSLFQSSGRGEDLRGAYHRGPRTWYCAIIYQVDQPASFRPTPKRPWERHLQRFRWFSFYRKLFVSFLTFFVDLVSTCQSCNF